MDVMSNPFVQYVVNNPVETAGLVVTGASIVCAGTPTPDPNSRLGRAYQVLEMLALVVGKAKQTGSPTATN